MEQRSWLTTSGVIWREETDLSEVAEDGLVLVEWADLAGSSL